MDTKVTLQASQRSAKSRIKNYNIFFISISCPINYTRGCAPSELSILFLTKLTIRVLHFRVIEIGTPKKITRLAYSKRKQMQLYNNLHNLPTRASCHHFIWNEYELNIFFLFYNMNLKHNAGVVLVQATTIYCYGFRTTWLVESAEWCYRKSTHSNHNN